jgi:hypothetical protein
VTGDTTGHPTYNRVIAGGEPYGLSGVGTAVPYEVKPFSVATTGAYDFLVYGIDPEAWDTYLTVYTGSFNPNAATDNVVGANDDYPTIGISGLSDLALTAGTNYFAVISGYGNTDFGQYSLEIAGPGTITMGVAAAAVPEPATWVMMLGGVGMIGGALRLKRRKAKLATA